MKRPSFQFYPGDWSSNPNLKRCSFAEKGIWLEVMCLMHDQPEYGLIRWTLREIAEAVKCKPAELQALVRKGVMKGHDESVSDAFVYIPRSGRKDGEPVVLVAIQAGPVWYSSRMVRDEYVRTIRAEAGANGDAPKATPKATPKGGLGEPIGGGFGPRGSSSSSSPSGKDNNPPAPRVPLWSPPEWMPATQWAAFVSMRKAKGKRAPFTDEARDGIVADLAKFRAAGHDIAEVLQTSVNNGWSGVFAPKAPTASKPASDLSQLFARGAA